MLPMGYPEEYTKPMSEELTNNGITELKTKEEVELAFSNNEEFLLFVNSVCGCSAGVARPAIITAAKEVNIPVFSVFAGVDKEATNTAREYLDSEPSSPCISLIQKSKETWHMPRHEIEGNNIKELVKAIAEHTEKA